MGPHLGAALILALTLSLNGLAQSTDPAITVNGSPIVLSMPVVRIGSAWFVPLLPIARALNVELTISAGSPVLQARRSDGLDITYDFRTGEIRNRYVLIGRVKKYQDVKPSVSADTVLFPIDGVVALLDVDVVEDRQRNLLQISSTPGSAANSVSPSVLNVGGVNYRYGLTTNGRKLAQFMDLTGEGLIGDIRIKEKALVSSYPGQGLLGLSQGTVRAEWQENKALIIGNQNIYTGLDALNSAVLGASHERVTRGFRSSTYLGRVAGTTSGTVGMNRPAYDATVAGTSFRRGGAAGELSFAANLFRGATRSGGTIGFAYTAPVSSRNQLKVQALLGEFSGLSSRTVLVRSSLPPAIFQEQDQTLVVTEERRRERVNGTGPAFSIADAFTPVRQLTVSGQYELYGRNFLGATGDSRFNAQSTRAVSVTVRPVNFFSVNGGINERRSFIGDTHVARNYTYGANTSIPRVVPVQLGFFRSIQKDPASPLSEFVMTQYSAGLPAVGRYSGNVTLSDLSFKGEKVRNVNSIVTASFERLGQIGLHDQIQFGSNHRIGVQVFRELANGTVRIGLDRVFSQHGFNGFAPAASLQVALPHGRALQISYIGNGRNHLLQLEFGGRFRHNNEVELDSRGSPRIVGNAPLLGRVYLDTDFNGKFDSAIDRPVSGVVVWLDDSKSATTDAEGFYRFDQLEPGAHQIRSDISGVPADMTFAGAAERTVSLAPYRNNIQDLTLVKTGRVAGKVLYMDYSDMDNPVERPLPDARIIVTDRFDTFSEINGQFFIGDLPPGDYAFRLDPNTVPKNYAPKQSVVAVTVKAGESVDGILFQLMVPPKAVIQRTMPPRDTTQLNLGR